MLYILSRRSFPEDADTRRIYVSYRYGKSVYTLVAKQSTVVNTFITHRAIWKYNNRNLVKKRNHEPVIMTAFIGTSNVLPTIEEYMGPQNNRHDFSGIKVSTLFPSIQDGQKLSISMFTRNGIEQKWHERDDIMTL